MAGSLFVEVTRRGYACSERALLAALTEMYVQRVSSGSTRSWRFS
jgi:hypothetical protein